MTAPSKTPAELGAIFRRLPEPIRAAFEHWEDPKIYYGAVFRRTGDTVRGYKVGECWLNNRDARAMEKRGLVRIGAWIVLTPFGRELLAWRRGEEA